MLNSEAADVFAIQKGVEKVKPSWLITELRQKQWNLWKEQNARPGATDEDDSVLDHDMEGMGTVGAVALDRDGNVAAATSTGGMTGKPKGRIGDTPIIGAGTWADTNIAVPFMMDASMVTVPSSSSTEPIPALKRGSSSINSTACVTASNASIEPDSSASPIELRTRCMQRIRSGSR